MSVQALPQWALGKDGAVTLAPLNINSAGVASPGTSVSFNGIIDVEGNEWGNEPNQEEISPADLTQSNWENLADDFTYSLQEILRVPQTGAAGSAASHSVMLPLMRAGTKFVATFTLGGETLTFYGVRSRETAPWRGKGKRTYGVTFRQIGIPPTLSP